MAIEPRPLGPDEQLLFLHIPKTAGTSLIRLLDQHFVEDELCPVDWPNRYLLREIQKDEIQRARFIRGHFAFHAVIEMFAHPPRVVTMLRDPVERFVSAFEHMRRIVTGEERPRGVKLPPPVLERDQILRERYPEVANGRMGLEEFVERPDLTRWLANVYGRGLGELKNHAVALQRVETFDFVGITEEFERSVELLCYLLGLPAPGKVWRLNVAPRSRKRGERWNLPAHLRRQIEQLVANDLDIYLKARERFERDYAAMEKAKQQRRFYLTRWLWPGGPEREKGHSGFRFDFQRVPIGHGWQVGKRHPDGGILRFVQQGEVAQLFFSLVPQRWRLQIGIWAPSGSPRGSLSISFNGHPVSYSFNKNLEQRDVLVAEAVVPAEWIRGEEENVLAFRWQPMQRQIWQQQMREWLLRGVRFLQYRLGFWAFLERVAARFASLPAEEIAFRWIEFLPANE